MGKWQHQYSPYFFMFMNQSDIWCYFEGLDGGEEDGYHETAK